MTGKIVKTIIETAGQNGFQMYRIPGIIATQKGTLIAYYECRHGGDWSITDLVHRISNDNGESWSERKLIVSGMDRDTVHNAIMFADDNLIHLIWHRNYREAYYQCSNDEGQTFSQPVDITYVYNDVRQDFHWLVIAAGPGHGIRLQNGRLLVSTWIAYNRTNSTRHWPSVVCVIYSDDHGATWQRGDVIYGDDKVIDPNEAVLAQIDDGRVLMNLRHRGDVRRRVVTTSPDGAFGWSNFRYDEALPDPVCAAGMTTYQDKILFVNCNFEETIKDPRKFLTLRVSCDNCATWPDSMLIEEFGGYSDIIVNPVSGDVFCFYEGERPEDSDSPFPPKHLKVAKITLDEFRKGI